MFMLYQTGSTTKLNHIGSINGLGHPFRPAISIIEIMMFIAVMSIAVIGASGYRYFSALQIRWSDSQITAGRIASQLCESWKGQGGGSGAYNPLTDPGIGLNITDASSSLAPQPPADFTLLEDGGHYKVVLGNRTYYSSMSYKIINNVNGNLETLSVIVTWPVNESIPDNTAMTHKPFCLSELLITH